MRLPVIIVNFKAYPEVLGHAGVELAMICSKVAESTGASIAIAPQMPDLARIAQEINLPVLSQHFDPVLPGNRTGWTPLLAVEEAGAAGTLLNHSERKMRLTDLKMAVQMCGEAGMESVVCADTIEEAKKVARFHPDYVAIEPPDLIGGDISVTTAKPEIVTDAVEAVRKVDSKIGVLCGAGVKAQEDVRKGLELGTVGVLLASGVVKARDPRKALADLAKGLMRR
jgi:triosephosphate isomerase